MWSLPPIIARRKHQTELLFTVAVVTVGAVVRACLAVDYGILDQRESAWLRVRIGGDHTHTVSVVDQDQI